MAPSPWASGGTRREQGIGKAGNPRFRERVGQARGLVRRVAIVAVARRLLVALWRYAGDGVMPEGAVAKG